jgi:regulatory protein
MADEAFHSGKSARKNTGKPRPPLNEERLRALALHYAGRYATTRHRLSDFMKRKVRERGWDTGIESESRNIISVLVEQFATLGYVDDHAFAASKAASLARRGYGAMRIRAALSHAGIEAEQARAVSEIEPEEAVLAVFRFAKRKRIGPFASVPADQKAYHRAFAACLRAGHSVENARKVLATSLDSVPIQGE